MSEPSDGDRPHKLTGRLGRPFREPRKRQGCRIYEFILELDDLEFFAKTTAEALPHLRSYRGWMADFGTSLNELGTEAVRPATEALARLSERLEVIAGLRSPFDWAEAMPACGGDTILTSGSSLRKHPKEVPFRDIFTKLADWLMAYVADGFTRSPYELTPIDDRSFKTFEAIARRLNELDNEPAPTRPGFTQKAPAEPSTVEPIKCKKRAACRVYNEGVYRGDIVSYLIEEERIGPASEDLGRQGAKIYPLREADRTALEKENHPRRATPK